MTDLTFSDCPHCGSTRFTRKSGKDSRGRQRYLCKDCHGTWVAETWERARSKPRRMAAALDDFESGMRLTDAARKHRLSLAVLTEALRTCLKRRPRCAG